MKAVKKGKRRILVVLTGSDKSELRNNDEASTKNTEAAAANEQAA